MTFSFLDLEVILEGRQTIVRRVVTRRSLDYNVHRSVFPAEVWIWVFRAWTSDRARAIEFYDRYMDVWGGPSGEFVTPMGQHIDEPGINGDIDTQALAVGTNLVDHKRSDIEVPNGRFVKFDNHSRVYLTRQSQDGSFVVKPDLQVDIPEDTRVLTSDAEVTFTGYDIRDNPMPLILPSNGVVYFDIELVEKK